MKVSSEYDSQYGSKVQIADNKKKGNSSWGEKDDYKDSSVRLAWSNNNGGFDPISSAELPMWGLIELTKAAAQNDLLNKSECAELIGYFTASIYRNI